MSLLCSLHKRSVGSPNRAPHVSCSSLSEQQGEQHRTDNATDDRSYDGDPGVPPIAAALACYGQYGVGDARAEVAGRVDSVAGRTTQREPDAEDEQADEQWVQRRGTAPNLSRVRKDAKDAEDQHERTDDLGDEVGGGIVDRRGRAEHAELEAGILGLWPVRQVGQPHYDAADEGPEELRDEVAGHHGPL